MRAKPSVQCAVGVFTFILILVAVPAAAAPSVQPTGKSVAGEVLVKFQPGASRDEVAGLERAHDVSQSERIAEVRTGTLWRMRSRSRNTEALIAALQKNPKVVYAEPNFELAPAVLPNDPDFAQLWALRNALGGADISAEAAWNVTTGSKSIVVGVVDTGVNYLHPDLAPNMWVNPGGKGNAACGAGTYGWNARNNTCDPMDDHYHGSHVAGTIGAAGNNGIGVAGINWNVSIMALKFLGDANNSSGTTAGAVSAINFAVQAKIDGVNLRVLCNSWGGGGFSKALLDIINKAHENDILFVAAAGNSGADNDFTPHYPSSYQTLNMIGVAATDPYDQLATFSNYGAKSVHVGAPGVGIYSTSLGQSYVSLNGTSMATPHVAGVAALVLAKTPSMTTAQLRSKILDSGDPVPSLAGKTTTGRRLNAARAVGAAPLPNFSLALGPGLQNVARGATTTYSVSVVPVNGFSAPVDLTVTGLPAGVTATFDPPTATTVSTLTVATSLTTPFVFAELMIAGEGGGLRRTVSATLNVTTPNLINECPSFRLSSTYHTGPAMGIALGDLNGDGETDLLSVAHNRNAVAVLLGHGNGTFRAPVEYAAGSVPMAVATADVNGDAQLDAVVANSGSTNISLLLGNGDGTFQPATQHEAGANPFAVSAGDFNGDGRTDVVVGNNGASSVTILMSNGDGTFAAPAHYPAASGPYSIAVGDVDRDGDADLAVAAYNANRVVLLLNGGNGTFAAPAGYDTGVSPSGVVFADFDRDGDLDVAASNYGGTNPVSILRNHGNGTFAAAVHYTGATQANALAAGDFDGDGKPDLLAASAGAMGLYLGNGDGTLQSVQYTNQGSFSEPGSVAAADIDSDGRTDVAYGDTIREHVAVLFNNSSCSYNCGTFSAGAVVAAGTNPDDLLAHDFNRDGRGDLAVVNDSGVSIRTGNGDGTFATGAAVTAGTDPRAVAAGDFDRDGKADLAIANDGSANVSVALGNGDGTFDPAVTYAAGTSPRDLAAGDFNGDGRLDLAVANHGSNNVSVLLGNGNGTFQNAVQFAVGTGPVGIVIADFDGDGKLDLSTANSGSNDVSILFGNGNGTFEAATTAAAGSTPAAIVTADWNRDGSPDLAIANSGSNDVSLLLGNGDGTFGAAVAFAAGLAPSALLAGDFNVDGQLDLAVANSGSHNVSIRAGNGNGSFAAATLLESGLGPVALASADWNRDGKPELAVVNGGASTIAMFVNVCPRPDLTVAKSHTGNFTQGGEGYTYSITVSNVGAGASKNLVTIEDTLPSGLRATAMSGPGWTCDPLSVTCTRSDVLAAGASWPPVTLTVGVSLKAPTTVINRVLLWGGGDSNVSNNTATDSATVVAVTDLTISLTHAGSFTRGATGRTFTIVARNAGGLPTSGTVTVSQNLPAALTAIAINGTGWNCNLGALMCTRNDVLGSGATYPPVTVTVDVAANAPAEVVSTATVAGGNQSNTGNDSATDTALVWSGSGCGTYAGIVNYSAGSTPSVLALGDFTGDGRQDIVVSNQHSHSVSVLAGRADGTFATAVHSPTGGQNPRDLAVADLNADGKLDVVTLNANTLDISVLLGNGNGTFATPVKYLTGTAPHSLTIGDVNADGLPDVAVTNGFMATISIFLGKGAGTFQSRTVVTMPGISVSLTGIRMADVNDDGLLDLLAASDAGVWRFIGNGDGTFQAPTGYPAGNVVPYIAIADLNRDGRVDVVAANQTDGGVSVLLGGANGSFLAPVSHRLAFGVAFVKIVDVDGDGFVDLLASTPNLSAIYTLRGNGDGTFQAPTTATLPGPGQFGVFDFNGDGRPDIAMLSYSSSIGVLLGGCADLTITKTHTGSFTAGFNGTYVVTVSNVGNGATQGTVTVVDTLPAGMTVISMGNTGWTCNMVTATCTRSDARNPNTSYPPIFVTVNVARTAAPSVTNTVSVSGGGDINTTNNSASDPTSIIHQPDLKITKTHVGLFTEGAVGRVYTISVGNVGSAPTAGAVTVTDSLGPELTATAISGPGWNCTMNPRVCTREDSLAVDGNYPPITLTVNVAATTQIFLSASASVSGGGDVTAENNYYSDFTSVLLTPTGLMATATSPTQISLTWKAVQFATRYRVLRSTNAEGPFSVIETPLSPGFIDSSLAANTTYYYRVQAGDPAIFTPDSATVSATTNATNTIAPTQLYLVTPCRVLDTRDSAQAGANATQLVQMTGACGIPAGAKAVVMNVTAVAPTANGFLTAYPASLAPRPNTSTVSYRTNKTRASNAILPLSDEGVLAVYNGGPAVHFLIDVTGYFK